MKQDRKRSQIQLLAILPPDRQGPWLRACLLSGGGEEIRVHQVSNLRELAKAARKMHIDLAMLWHEGSGQGILDMAQRLRALPGIGTAFIALGMKTHEGWHAPLLECGAITCLELDQIDPLLLVTTVRNAVELSKLRIAEANWVQREQKAAEAQASQLDQLLDAQQALLRRLDGLRDASDRSEGPDLITGTRQADPAEEAHRQFQLQVLRGEYATCLRQYSFDSSTSDPRHFHSLTIKIHGLAMQSQQIMRLHLESVSSLTEGSGHGSIRHLLSQSDRFLIELLLHLVDHSSRNSASNLPAADRSGLAKSPYIAA